MEIIIESEGLLYKEKIEMELDEKERQIVMVTERKRKSCRKSLRKIEMGQDGNKIKGSQSMKEFDENNESNENGLHGHRAATSWVRVLITASS